MFQLTSYMKSRGRGVLRSNMDKPRPLTQQQATRFGASRVSTAKPVRSGPL